MQFLKVFCNFTILVVENVGSEAALVTDSGGIKTEAGVDDLLEVVVHFGTNLHGLGEGGSTGGQNHELLHGQLVAGMGATVDHIESRSREDDVGVAGQVSNVSVEYFIVRAMRWNLNFCWFYL